MLDLSADDAGWIITAVLATIVIGLVAITSIRWHRR
jgi:hypothetical protein